MNRLFLGVALAASSSLVPAQLQSELAGTGAARSDFAKDRPAAGSRPGTERWIVMFRGPGQDLEPLRLAIASRAAPAEVDRLVAGLAARARADHAAFQRTLEARDGRLVHAWWLIHGAAVEIDPTHLGALAADPDVLQLVPDSLRRAGTLPIKKSTNSNNHGTDNVHAIVTGAGFAVAILDSGADSNMNGSGRPHRTFYPLGDPNNQTGGGLVGSRLVVNAQVGAMSADDLINHGTPVAAVAAGGPWGTPNSDFGHAPGAQIASYSLCDTTTCLTMLSTMVAAWQQVVTDRTRFRIVAANLSYEGSEPVEWPEQQAMDRAALVGDVAIAVMGGNQSVSTHYSHGATNVLAVGATDVDSKLVTAFSVRGPMNMYPQRTYPDLVANGASMLAPFADAEGTDRPSSGTSYSSPQVAGAMTLYRTLRTQASARETRAAVLHTTESIVMRNTPVPPNPRNLVGLGYLRVDALVAAALVSLVRHEGTLTPSTAIQTFTFPVTAGEWYAATVVWDRVVTTNQTWSNVDLRVTLQNQTVATGASPLNSYEKAAFRAPQSGVATVTVTAAGFEPGVTSIPFALLAGPTLRQYVAPRITGFGPACASALSVTGTPILGGTYTVQLLMPAPNTAAAFWTGVSDRSFGGIPLPLDLGPFGAPGCSLLASMDAVVGVATPSGVASVPITLPNDPSLVGVTLFQQMAHVTGVNALGVLTSNGIAVQIGGE